MGVLYGTTSVAVGHPFDTVKTKMQAQAGFESQSMLRTFSRTVREQGIRGLYRGCFPPLLGSGIFRSTQFAGEWVVSAMCLLTSQVLWWWTLPTTSQQRGAFLTFKNAKDPKVSFIRRFHCSKNYANCDSCPH